MTPVHFNFIQNTLIKKLFLQSNKYKNNTQIITYKHLQYSLYLNKKTTKEILNLYIILKLLTKKKPIHVFNKHKELVGFKINIPLIHLFLFKKLKKNKEKLIQILKNNIIIKNPTIFFNLENNKYIKLNLLKKIFINLIYKKKTNEKIKILQIFL